VVGVPCRDAPLPRCHRRRAAARCRLRNPAVAAPVDRGRRPLENIEAHNTQVSSFVNFETGELVFSVPMKAFTFRKSLMQTHFNEKFVESDKYPRGTFKGRIEDIKSVNLQKDGLYGVKVNGQLTIHGVTQPVATDGMLEVKNGRVVGRAIFTVTPEQFDIEIPLLVRNNIAKTIRIQVLADYEPYLAKNPN
jgi:polyisoprenoid-binding protein YceI